MRFCETVARASCNFPFPFLGLFFGGAVCPKGEDSMALAEVVVINKRVEMSE